jgi:threonine dehydrogenase-like Zn-dependent dehydrogenase
VVTDLEADKRERALRHGADVAVDAAAPGFVEQVLAGLDGPADAVFDCVANERSVRQAVTVLRRSGTLLVVGVPPKEFALPMPLVQDWELRVQGCANYTEQDILTALQMAADLPADEIISDHFPFTDAAVAFQWAGRNTTGKVVVGPGMEY